MRITMFGVSFVRLTAVTPLTSNKYEMVILLTENLSKLVGNSQGEVLFGLASEYLLSALKKYVTGTENGLERRCYALPPTASNASVTTNNEVTLVLPPTTK